MQPVPPAPIQPWPIGWGALGTDRIALFPDGKRLLQLDRPNDTVVSYNTFPAMAPAAGAPGVWVRGLGQCAEIAIEPRGTHAYMAYPLSLGIEVLGVQPSKQIDSFGDFPPRNVSVSTAAITTTTGTVGPAGGTVQTPEGAAVAFTPGSLATVTSIAVAPAQQVRYVTFGNFYDQQLGPAVQFFAANRQPVVFSGAATLTLPYDPTLIPSYRTESDIVVFYASFGKLQQTTPTSIDTVNHLLTVTVTQSLTGYQPCIVTPAPASILHVAVDPSGTRVYASGTNLSTGKTTMFMLPVDPNDGFLRTYIGTEDPAAITFHAITVVR
jgi:hypothetical protein